MLVSKQLCSKQATASLLVRQILAGLQIHLHGNALLELINLKVFGFLVHYVICNEENSSFVSCWDGVGRMGWVGGRGEGGLHCDPPQ